MNILVIGNGGREHALAWKIAQSSKSKRVYVAPGNAGTARENKCKNINIQADDIDALLEFALTHDIHLTVVGPELPLSLGIVDRFQAHNLACFGPTQKAAQLESSKRFCKQFMHDNQIPTAAFATFTDSKDAVAYLQKQTLPIVIKASGLAAGKGVIIAHDLATGEQTIRNMLDNNQFGTAQDGIVIEAFLTGEELSFIALVDGTNVIPLASSQDHKRLLDGDQGPNTGGMGAYSPAPLCTPELECRIMQTVMQPTVDALAQAGTPYVGFLYAGIMITKNQDINVLEFNCRLGDPETQPLMLRLESDLIDLCLLALNGQLRNTPIQWNPSTALSVVMVADGYPVNYPKGQIITGLDSNFPNSKVFHAGTELNADHTVTAGGRVLSVTSLGEDLAAAKTTAYAHVNNIHWPDCQYRRDIGQRGLTLTQTEPR